MNIILEKVRAARKSKGYSQVELADKIGVGQKTYSSWERGRTQLKIANLQLIAKALEVDVKVFWDPEQFENPEWKQHPDMPFTIGEAPVFPDKTMVPAEECNKKIAAMKKEIDRLTSMNLALSRSLNSLFDQQATAS